MATRVRILGDVRLIHSAVERTVPGRRNSFSDVTSGKGYGVNISKLWAQPHYSTLPLSRHLMNRIAGSPVPPYWDLSSTENNSRAQHLTNKLPLDRFTEVNVQEFLSACAIEEKKYKHRACEMPAGCCQSTDDCVSCQVKLLKDSVKQCHKKINHSSNISSGRETASGAMILVSGSSMILAPPPSPDTYILDRYSSSMKSSRSGRRTSFSATSTKPFSPSSDTRYYFNRPSSMISSNSEHKHSLSSNKTHPPSPDLSNPDSPGKGLCSPDRSALRSPVVKIFPHTEVIIGSDQTESEADLTVATDEESTIHDHKTVNENHDVVSNIEELEQERFDVVISKPKRTTLEQKYHSSNANTQTELDTSDVTAVNDKSAKERYDVTDIKISVSPNNKAEMFSDEPLTRKHDVSVDDVTINQMRTPQGTDEVIINKDHLRPESIDSIAGVENVSTQNFSHIMFADNKTLQDQADKIFKNVAYKQSLRDEKRRSRHSFKHSRRSTNNAQVGRLFTLPKYIHKRTVPASENLPTVNVQKLERVSTNQKLSDMWIIAPKKSVN